MEYDDNVKLHSVLLLHNSAALSYQIITTAIKTDNVTTIKMFIEKKELTSKTKFRVHLTKPVL